MIKGIIFDFNRTLYNPDKHRVFRGTKGLLGKLYKRFILSLVTTEGSDIYSILESSKLTTFFECVEGIKDKTPEIFLKCSQTMNLEPSEVIVVGDRIKGEIVAGNRAGMTTVWLRRGKFATELPSSRIEEPDFIIEDLRELEKILKKHD